VKLNLKFSPFSFVARKIFSNLQRQCRSQRGHSEQQWRWQYAQCTVQRSEGSEFMKKEKKKKVKERKKSAIILWKSNYHKFNY